MSRFQKESTFYAKLIHLTVAKMAKSEILALTLSYLQVMYTRRILYCVLADNVHYL